MTSGNFSLIDPNTINIPRDERQRRELTEIDSLKASIRAIGLINPIVIDRQHNLVAGERRLTACLELGLAQVAVQYTDELDPAALHLIELEENVKRVDLPWQDQVRAVEEYHKLREKQEGEWNVAQTAEELGLSEAHVGRHLLVAENLDNELVRDADKFSTAINAARRLRERQAASTKRAIETEIEQTLGLEPTSGEPPELTAEGEPAPKPKKPARAAIKQADFTEWSAQYSGPAFNLIHCDFPYGVGVGDKSGQSSRQATGSYTDTPETYFNLLNTFVTNGERFIAPSAHLIFWFSMKFYQVTFEALTAGGWNVVETPLVWHKTDNSGIIPDANRQPRRIYETAFFASRGDRKIVRAVANCVGAPTTREFHTSEKPRSVLRHFMRMLVDETTICLDPTAGSGNAIRVADELGARAALGLELNPEFAETAQHNLAREPELNL